MPILCEPAATAANLMRSLGRDARAADSLQAVATMLEADPTETLVIIGPDMPIGDALTFSSTLRLTRPAVGVILARVHVDVALLTHALRAGVREVVQTDDPAALTAACRRSYEVSRRLISTPLPPAEPEPARNGKVVTVFAAKGGCGKTTFAINLGVALANAADVRVCVVDLDLSFGDVAISIQLDPAKTIVDAVPMAGHLDTTGASSLLTRYRPSLHMLLAPVTPG